MNVLILDDDAGLHSLICGLARGARRPATAPLSEPVRAAIHDLTARKLVSSADLVDAALDAMFARSCPART